MQETQVQSLGREDPLDREMATHSGILACEIPWTEGPGRLQSMGSKESDTTYPVNNSHLNGYGWYLIAVLTCSPLLILKLGCFCCCCMWFFIYAEYYIRYMICKCVFPFCGLPLHSVDSIL
ncbi:unnamed protein product [Rangifer tarandus platyrhynchus]|uniref:Uncharacterized protein n=2 Tax=Rangifer tarandus platyrhynchus TaxID=3082113 RepID=A0ABN8Z399_RANTA|nr:unnamed protein product [Rangifer tarandus platyrhynchus]